MYSQKKLKSEEITGTKHWGENMKQWWKAQCLDEEMETRHKLYRDTKWQSVGNT